MEEDPRAHQLKDITLRGYKCLMCGHRFIKSYSDYQYFLEIMETYPKTLLTEEKIFSFKVPIDCPKCGSLEGKRICIDTKLYDDFFETEKKTESNLEDLLNRIIEKKTTEGVK